MLKVLDPKQKYKLWNNPNDFNDLDDLNLSPKQVNDIDELIVKNGGWTDIHSKEKTEMKIIIELIR